MQVVINFVITVKLSNTFQHLPVPNLQWLLQIAGKKQTSGMIYYDIFLKNPPEVVSNSQHFSLVDRNTKFQLGSKSSSMWIITPNNGQAKIVILGTYSRFLQAYFFNLFILFCLNQHIIKHTKVNYYKQIAKYKIKTKYKLVQINKKLKIKK